MSCAVSSSATARSLESIRNRTPKPSSRSSALSIIGAGRACRSSCGLASAWPKASASSRSLSASRRRACFQAIPALDRKGPDHLTFDLADQSKVSLSFYGKKPGPGMRLDKQSLQFAIRDTGLGGDVLEAYERLILDAMRGDHTLFCSAEGIERLWEVSEPLLVSPPPVKVYAPGSWGPPAIYQLIA